MIAPLERQSFDRNERRRAIASGFEYVEPGEESDHSSDALETVRFLVSRHPVTALAVASLIGLGLGFAVKRGVKQ